MKNLGVIANTEKPRAAAVLARLCQVAGEKGLNLVASGATSALMPERCEACQSDDFRSVDAVVALGGDGTMLAAVRQLHGLDKPLIGLNIGSLGFMTSIAECDLEAALECLRADSYSESRRSLAECVISDGHGVSETALALNDIVLRNGESSRVIRLELSVDGRFVTSYVCDGIILSTPTGSTGYSLSANGPIMLPETEAFVISVICPHTLSSRPLVVPDRCNLSICVGDRSNGIRLSVDGLDLQQLDEGDCIAIRRSETEVRFLHLPGYDYFGVLRQKLNWSGSATNGKA